MNTSDLKLNNGAEIPQIALGLWKNKDEAECKETVKTALEIGYRHFDSAQYYDNEAYVEAAVKESTVDREDVFVTTKIAVKNFGYKRTIKSFEKSLVNLQMDYVDLLLLHFPVSVLRGRSWKALEQIYKEGKAKSIGVSNYTIRHLEELLKDCQVKPAINQVELHVYLQQPELLRFCADKGIVVEAYSPLAHNNGLDNPVLAEIAVKHQKTAAQIMIRWCIEVGTVPLPKSTRKERLQENLNVFDFSLDAEDMAKLKMLNKNLRTCWDPTRVP